TKLKHIEQEYEWLKKCFQRLKDENSRLKKELQEVACFSLKADNHQPLPQLPLPFYIRYPTTTMMMHNLCHKIGKSKEITKVAVVNGGNMGQILHDDSNNKNAFVSKLFYNIKRACVEGLGKTISVITLILKERSPPYFSVNAIGTKEKEAETLCLDEDEDIEQRNTSVLTKSNLAAGKLVVCPTSLLRQWNDELQNKIINEANLSVLVYYGVNRTKDPIELAKYDVILTADAIVGMEVTVMIMSLKAASLGLNMVAACHVILLDLWWNPTTEDQAIDRAHRIGQTRPVTVFRFTVKDAIEDRILALQKRKREMVESVFGDDKNGGCETRLTVADMEYLFQA
nr:helicase-like transcription factor CHR28 [Tanacetum cinerariifolium]